MFKIIGLFKRRSGMSMEDFIAYYETHHQKLGVHFLPTALEYNRHYFLPAPYPIKGEPNGGLVMEPEYDVMTEIVFTDKIAYEDAFGKLAEPATSAVITTDEENLFDRPKSRLVFVETYKSSMTKR